MATKLERRHGTCAVHGHVEGTREVPGPTFPFLLYALRRMKARRQPFLCPRCGAVVEPD